MLMMPALATELPTNQAVLVAASRSVGATPVFGSCDPVRMWYPNYPNDGGNALSSTATTIAAGAFKGKTPEQNMEIDRTAKETLVAPPKNGKVVYQTSKREPGRMYAYYVPNPGFLGRDRLTMEVEAGGKRLRVEHFIRVLDDFSGEGDSPKIACDNKMWWRISR